MFSTKEKIMAKPQDSTGVVNLIGVGTTIVGDVTSSGDIRIDGSLLVPLIQKERLLLVQPEWLMEMLTLQTRIFLEN